MAAKDDSAVKREEFLAALRSLRPVPEADAEPAEPEDEGDEAEESGVMAAIAAGVRAEARRGNGHDRDAAEQRSRGGALTPFGRGEPEDRRLAVSDESREGPTFEALVQKTLAKELRGWLHDNLEEITERVVRDEIRSMGRRRG